MTPTDEAAVSLDGTIIRSGVATDLDVLIAIDDDASTLFVEAGLDVDLPPAHEFSLHERLHLRESLVAGSVFVAMHAPATPVGFSAVTERDGEPFLQQISVRRQCMRQGIGAALLELSIELAGKRRAPALWLTTYAHLPWNGPFYERHGFERVPLNECGFELRRDYEFERRWLPQPTKRIVMRRPLV